eukprot:TRINITY_DN10400_c0_g1_i1.p1 TRINITY_DN10400_c0_g1~~TRINITY_DN10400_c0_g1_i1.p1  ORF type:complete len:513 (-),score=95.13 TRINITY_DN10400_c0_g1_i1:479-2017(-)
MSSTTAQASSTCSSFGSSTSLSSASTSVVFASSCSSASEEKKESGALAEQYKTKGNEFFKQNKFSSAMEWYDKAIQLKGDDPAFFTNRAFCHIRLEEYGSAIEDASSAIKLNPNFTKAYYRRGDAYLALCKYFPARADLLQVTKAAPSDQMAKKKLAECERAIRAHMFQKAIESEEILPSKSVDLSAFAVDSSYTGPKLPDDGTVTPEFVTQLIEHFRAGKRLARKYVYQLALNVITLLKKLPTLLELDAPTSDGKFTICGDVHGQFYDVCNIFKINGIPSTTNPYLFNGDFVDRGSFSYEVIVLFFALKSLFPHHFHLVRGNHETNNMNEMFGFKGEITNKVDSSIFGLFGEAFSALPLAACIGRKILIMHGGLFSKDGVTLKDIQMIDRFRQPPDSGLMSDLLWSDPKPSPGRMSSKRGVGILFGPDVTSKFLKDNNLDVLIRSHEMKQEGYSVDHDGKCITVFSAPNYCDQMDNKGAFITIKSDLKPSFTSFPAVEHPKAATYAPMGLF